MSGAFAPDTALDARRAPCAARVEDVRRIVVLRANAVGDFVFALPALEALRHAYPDAEIVLLGKPWHAQFLHARPGAIDRVVALPGVPGVTAPPDAPWDDAARVLLQRLRDARFDLALQWHGGGGYSNPLVHALRARVTSGLRADGAAPLDRALAYVQWRNERLRLLEAAALVGAAPVSLAAKLAVTPRDRDEAAAALPPSSRPLAVLQPGSTDPRRHWPAASFAAIGDWLAGEGFDVAINGSAGEAAIVAAVRDAMRRPGIAIAPSLRGLVGVLARAALVVASDSGPLYLAEALGVPTVGICWFGNALVSAPLVADRHRQAIAWRLHCPVCGAPNVATRCPHDASFVADVGVDEVRAHAQALLDGG